MIWCDKHGDGIPAPEARGGLRAGVATTIRGCVRIARGAITAKKVDGSGWLWVTVTIHGPRGNESRVA